MMTDEKVLGTVFDSIGIGSSEVESADVRRKPENYPQASCVAETEPEPRLPNSQV